MNNIKTFREVIRDIEEGEIYTDGRTEIGMFKAKISIYEEGNFNMLSYTYSNDYRNFKLKRNTYSFDEAFKAYEEGKEIESVVTNCKYKSIDGIHYFKDKISNKFAERWAVCDGFEISEIREKWYINNTEEEEINE